MFAVIRAGGKQYRVSPGDVIEVEKVADDAGTLEFTPLLVVDDDGKTRAGESQVSGAVVTARVVGDAKGPKVRVLKYKNKSRYRKVTGHRQKYSSIEIADIKLRRSGRKKASEEVAADGS